MQKDFSSCLSAPWAGYKIILGRCFRTSESAGNGAKRRDFLCLIFIIYKINGSDLERTPKMKQNCGECVYFELKGIVPGSPNWGLCIKFTKEVIGSGKTSPFFRWEDDTCSNFKARKKLSDFRTRTTKT